MFFDAWQFSADQRNCLPWWAKANGLACFMVSLALMDILLVMVYLTKGPGTWKLKERG